MGRRKDIFPLLLFGIVLITALVALVVISSVLNTSDRSGGFLEGRQLTGAVVAGGESTYANAKDSILNSATAHLTVQPSGANAFAVRVTTESGADQFVYRRGYYSKNVSGQKVWVPFNFTEATVNGTGWIRGNASYTLSQFQGAEAEEYVIAFICRRYSGSSGYICGADPMTQRWTLQAYNTSIVSCGGGNFTCQRSSGASACVNLNTSNTDCGSCNNACSGTCINGACVPPCTSVSGQFCNTTAPANAVNATGTCGGTLSCFKCAANFNYANGACVAVANNSAGNNTSNACTPACTTPGAKQCDPANPKLIRECKNDTGCPYWGAAVACDAQGLQVCNNATNSCHDITCVALGKGVCATAAPIAGMTASTTFTCGVDKTCYVCPQNQIYQNGQCVAATPAVTCTPTCTQLGAKQCFLAGPPGQYQECTNATGCLKWAAPQLCPNNAACPAGAAGCSGTTPAPGGTTPGPGGTTPAPGGTTPNTTQPNSTQPNATQPPNLNPGITCLHVSTDRSNQAVTQCFQLDRVNNFCCTQMIPNANNMLWNSQSGCPLGYAQCVKCKNGYKFDGNNACIGTCEDAADHVCSSTAPTNGQSVEGQCYLADPTCRKCTDAAKTCYKCAEGYVADRTTGQCVRPKCINNAPNPALCGGTTFTPENAACGGKTYWCRSFNTTINTPSTSNYAWAETTHCKTLNSAYPAGPIKDYCTTVHAGTTQLQCLRTAAGDAWSTPCNPVSGCNIQTGTCGGTSTPPTTPPATGQCDANGYPTQACTASTSCNTEVTCGNNVYVCRSISDWNNGAWGWVAKFSPAGSCHSYTSCSKVARCENNAYYCRSFDGGSSYNWVEDSEPAAQCTSGTCSKTTMCEGRQFYCASDPTSQYNTGVTWRECANGCTGSQCTQPCNGCTIGGTCYAAGAENSWNPCQTCDPARSTTQWSARAENEFCHVGTSNPGVCRGGICTAGCIIDGEFIRNGQTQPGNSCSYCYAAQSQTSWTAIPDGSACSGGTCQDGRCTECRDYLNIEANNWHNVDCAGHSEGLVCMEGQCGCVNDGHCGEGQTCDSSQRCVSNSGGSATALPTARTESCWHWWLWSCK